MIRLQGYLAATLVVLIWSGWLVVSRSGVQTELTAFDLAGIRYSISGLVALPFVLWHKPWQGMAPLRITVLTVLLGPFYILCAFGGFNFAPAAHGGIFMNGALPAITVFIGWMWLSAKIRWQHLVGIVLIILGALFAAADASKLSMVQSWRGDVLFLLAGVMFSAYMVLSRLWKVSFWQILLCSSVINGIFYAPMWFFLPSGLTRAPGADLLLQGFYQGFLPTFFGLFLVAWAARNIGSAATSALMAGVPAVVTILSVVLLNEVPGFYGWLSIMILTPGILLVVLAPSQSQTLP